MLVDHWGQAEGRTDIYVRDAARTAAGGGGPPLPTGPAAGEVLHAGELEIRIGEGLVRVSGRVLTLSVREFQLLVALARREGGILRRDELYAQVWGSELRPGDRSVDVYVSKLRAKLERATPDRRFIHTHPGFGYRFQPQPSQNLDNGPSVEGQTSPGAALLGVRPHRKGDQT
ncbi:MAG: hypothetical protein NVSMB51_05060 [Solirubrobacteraceae bacterium]